MKNLVPILATDDYFLLRRELDKKKFSHEIIITSLDEAKPLPFLKNYTYLLISNLIDERIFELSVPIIQWVREFDKNDSRLTILEQFSKERLEKSIIKKYSKEISEEILELTTVYGEINNELYKYKYSKDYHISFRYKNEKEFCLDLLNKKELKYIPNYNVMYVLAILFNLGNKDVQRVCLEVEDKIRRFLLNENQLEYLILKVRSVL